MLYTKAVQFSCFLLSWPVSDQTVSSCMILLNECLIKLQPRARGEGKNKRGDTNPNDNVSTCSPDGSRGMRRARKGRESVTWFMSNCQRTGGWPVSQIGLFVRMGVVMHLGLSLCDWLNSLAIQRVNAVKSCISCRFWNGESLGLCRDLFTRFDHYEERL